jgi:hypothetical protein
MLFTLSLPVSRRRLLFVRAGLGAILTSILIIGMTAYILLHRPGAASASLALCYIARVLVCTMAVYSLSVFLACVLDEVWQFMGGCLVWSGVFLLQTRFDAVAWVSPIRGMSQISYAGNALASWPPVLASILLTAILLSASVLVLQHKEY